MNSSSLGEKSATNIVMESCPDSLDLFAGGGEMGALMRAFDWSKTPLGSPKNWPQSLRTSLSICLASRFPIVLYWGPESVVLYNDAYSVILGSKHPWALGQTCRVCWAEIWDTIGPMLGSVVKTGKATWSDDLLLMLRRFGYSEECYFSFSFTPVQVESGTVGGVFTAVIETTEKVIGERRLRTLRDLAARAVAAKSEQHAWEIAASTLNENRKDVPFAILLQNAGEGFRMAGSAGISSAHRLCKALCEPGSELFQKAALVVQSGASAELEDLSVLADDLPRGPWDMAPSKALLLPIAALGQRPSGALFVAVSPAKALDESYRAFFDLVARQIATSIADVRVNAQLHEELAVGTRLQQLSTRLVQVDGFKELLTEVLDAAIDITRADRGNIQLFEGDSLKIVAHRGFDEQFLAFFNSVNEGTAACGTALAQGKRVIVEDVAQSPIFVGSPAIETMLAANVRAVQATPLTSPSGRVLGMLSTHYSRPHRATDRQLNALDVLARLAADLIRRRQTEDELRNSEQRLRLAHQAAAIGTFQLDLQTNQNRWSPELEAMYGLPPGGFRGTIKAWEELLHPEDRAATIKKVESSLQSHGPVQAEWRVVWPDGSVHWISGRWQVIKDEWGKNLSLTGINIDVTERKQAEEAQRRLAAIVESSDDAIASKDLNGIVTSWNKGAERLFGYKAEEIVGRSILLIIPPDLHGDENMILSKIRVGERIEHFETVRITKAGERIDVSLTISPVRDRDGNVIGAAKIVRDITQSKKIERTLRTTEKLATAGRLAATVAHEMNNPLEAINNLIFLAKRDVSKNQRVADYLESAERELGRVAHIARQTLGFYRDSSAPVRFNVAKTLDDLLYLYEKRLETRHIKVTRQYEPGVEITAFSGEIRQAFSNLISNSIDAMPGSGSLVIRVSRSRQWTNFGQAGVRVTILDTGSGIGARDRKNLFEPFFTTKADVGTGLGLWITKNIVDKHHGSIRFKSRTHGEDHGTAFSIFLPSNEQIGATGEAAEAEDAVA